ncbi:MAG: hypothetical protein HFH35_01460 [Eubacterium sp.]|nr:hypothetical protein [Eubacterium sp.]
MSSQDKLEHVLRDMHVMISKSEVYDTDRIIVSKTDIFNLIDRLNASVYEIMDEYELTQQSRDRALRERKKEGDKIIWDASRQAEDIYAASVLYTEEALNHLHVIMGQADEAVSSLYQDFLDNMDRQRNTIRENQLELKSQLQLLADTEKYLRLIEERNREIERERAEKEGKKIKEKSVESLFTVKPEIKINEDYFRKMGIPLEKEQEKNDEDEDPLLPDEGVIDSSLKKANAPAKEKTDTADSETDEKQADSSQDQKADVKDGENPEQSNTKNSSQQSADEKKDAAQPADPVIEETGKKKMNTDFFHWHEEELDQTEEPKHEKISLLDKLMGKKKSKEDIT